MAVALNYAETVMDMDDKWSKLTPDDRKAYVERLRTTVLELMVTRANRQNLDSADIAKRTGYTRAWVSSINGLKNQRFEALAEFATAIGYPLSFFVAMAEDIIAIEDEHTPKKADNEDEELGEGSDE